MFQAIILVYFLHINFSSAQFVAPYSPESSVSSTNTLQSPCSDVFTYDPLEADGSRWYGTITIKNYITELSGVWISFILDKPPVEFGAEFGTTQQKEINEFLVKNPEYKVAVGDTLQFRIYADFILGKAPPKLLGFRINGQIVCPESGINQKSIPEETVSPCSALFQNELRGPEKNVWHGNINVSTNFDISGVWLRAVFDKPVTELETNFGEVGRRGDGEFLIKNPRHTMKVGENLLIQISPHFNSNESPPKLVEIRLNARTICRENGAESTTISVLK